MHSYKLNLFPFVLKNVRGSNFFPVCAQNEQMPRWRVNQMISQWRRLRWTRAHHFIPLNGIRPGRVARSGSAAILMSSVIPSLSPEVLGRKPSGGTLVWHSPWAVPAPLTGGDKCRKRSAIAYYTALWASLSPPSALQHQNDFRPAPGEHLKGVWLRAVEEPDAGKEARLWCCPLPSLPLEDYFLFSGLMVCRVGGRTSLTGEGHPQGRGQRIHWAQGESIRTSLQIYYNLGNKREIKLSGV